jgi:hypothetical protein
MDVEVIPGPIELLIPGASHDGHVVTGFLQACRFPINAEIEVEVGKGNHADVHSVVAESSKSLVVGKGKEQPVNNLTGCSFSENECGDPGVRSPSRNEIFERGGVGRCLKDLLGPKKGIRTVRNQNVQSRSTDRHTQHQNYC